MVHFLGFVAGPLLAYAIGTSALPAGSDSTGKNSHGKTLQMTVDEILNAPVAAANFANPAFKPINAGSNSSIIAAVPDFNAPVVDLPAVKASISSAAATATAAAHLDPTATASASSLNSRSLEKRRVPPLALQYVSKSSSLAFL